MCRSVPAPWSQESGLLLVGSGIRANQLTGRPAPHHKVARGLVAWTKELIDTNPLISSLLVICLGWCSNFVGSETECETTAEYGLQHNSTSPPPVTHTVCIYCTFSLGRGKGGGEVREKEEGQPYTGIVPSSMGASVHKLGRKYKPLSECISSL